MSVYSLNSTSSNFVFTVQAVILQQLLGDFSKLFISCFMRFIGVKNGNWQIYGIPRLVVTDYSYFALIVFQCARTGGPDHIPPELIDHVLPVVNNRYHVEYIFEFKTG